METGQGMVGGMMQRTYTLMCSAYFPSLCRLALRGETPHNALKEEGIEVHHREESAGFIRRGRGRKGIRQVEIMTRK